MFPNVLCTKIIPPSGHTRTLARPRITDTLNQAFEYRLTILQAEAGYGKSTALTELAETVQPLAWYQVNEEDNDPLVFLLHLYHAFMQALPNLPDLPLQFLESWDVTTQGTGPWRGVRAPVVFYNRSNEAGALLKPGDFDWDAIFSQGIRWFHSGGIFAALSETTGEVIIEGMKAAKTAVAITSFDLNYRAKLWNIWGGQEKAVSVLNRIVEHVDVLVGNEEDLQLGLSIPGPEVEKRSKLDPSAFLEMIDKVTDKYPNLKIVATTLREVHASNHHSWSAVAWIDGQTYRAPTTELHVHDRVGGGDGFASGFFYGLLSGEEPQDAVDLGWAHGALLTTFPGDTTMATLEQVTAFAQGGSARIQR